MNAYSTESRSGDLRPFAFTGPKTRSTAGPGAGCLSGAGSMASAKKGCDRPQHRRQQESIRTGTLTFRNPELIAIGGETEFANHRGNRRRDLLCVTLTNWSVPIWFSHTSNDPARSDRKAMSFHPQARSPRPFRHLAKSVSRSVLAPASGFRQK